MSPTTSSNICHTEKDNDPASLPNVSEEAGCSVGEDSETYLAEENEAVEGLSQP